MAYYTYTTDAIGYFVERETGNHFEYSLNNEQDDYSKFIAKNYPHKVWVGGEGVAGMSGWRYANVKKTVCYIITDEDENGIVLERWYLKKNMVY